MRFICILSISLTVSACAASSTFAECTQPHPSAVSAPDTLIDRTERIVIAELSPLNIGEAAPEKDDPLTIDREKEIAPALEGRGDGDRTVTTLALARFKVLEDIKGGGEPFIFLAGASGGSRAGEDFVGHRAGEFWADLQTGRADIGPDCRVEASFASGIRYLIFIGPPHVKSYEAIKIDDDKWLEYVRARVSSSN